MLSAHVSDTVPGADAAPEHVLDSREAGSRFLRGSTLRLGAFAVGIAAGVGATPLAVHHLGRARWGQYATVTSIMFIAAALTEGGLGQMGARELSVGDAGAREEFVRDLLGMRIALTLLGALVAFCFSLAAGYERVVVEGTAIAGVGMLLVNISGTLALPLSVELRLGSVALTELVPQLATAVTMVILVVFGAGLLPFFAASVAAGATGLLLTASIVRSRISLLPAFRARRWRPLLRQTIVYAAATATGAIYYRIVLIATSLLSTKSETGYFGLAFRILELTAVVPWMIAGAAFPILVRSAWNDFVRLRYAIDRLLRGALIVGGWFALCLVLGAPFGIRVLDLGAHQFTPSILVLRILGTTIPATFVLATFSYALLSLQLYRQLLVANAVVIVLAVVLSAALIPPLGADGSALVSLVLEVVLMCAYVLALARARRQLLPPLRGIERIALALALAFLVGVPLWHEPVAAVGAASAAFAIALALLRAVPPELVALLLRRGAR